ncbi:sulfatase family protein [Lignipirellula cremea]|uniref:sulfatase family protein n=1 Tax=Lignipirellula cremea TaxID=2528010 RepID=UPI0018D23CAB|nr:arylsulfatase [Lignipirellula cremea]
MFAADNPSVPNIVLILADDLGYGDLGCYDGASKIPTPELDRLAGRGMRFTDAHSPSAVCSPTRYGLLTGRYAWRTEMKQAVLWSYDRPLIETDRLTLPRLLRRRGYVTACIGKWHLGWEWKTADGQPLALPMKIGEPGRHAERLKLAQAVDYTQPLGGGPLGAGFDTYFGDDVINQPPFLWIENDRCQTLPTLPEHPNVLRGSSNGPCTPDWDQAAVLPEMADRAVAYLRSRAKQPEQPFLLYFPLTAPHLPIVPPAEFARRSTYGPYGDFVAYVDAVVGRVLHELQATGLDRNTLVIFSSDNGSYAKAEKGHRPNGPFRGRKGMIFDGGHRVPLLVRWPGQVTAGSVNDQLVGLNDLLATTASLVGEELEAGQAPDSVDLTPTWRNPETAVRSQLVHHSVTGEFALRSGRWKLIPAMRLLFDMRADPAETRNLWDEQPAVVARLQEQLQAIIGDDGP